MCHYTKCAQLRRVRICHCIFHIDFSDNVSGCGTGLGEMRSLLTVFTHKKSSYYNSSFQMI